MTRVRLPNPVDTIAVVGVVALAIGVGYRFGWDLALALVGALLLLYAILCAIVASRSEVSP